MRLNISYKRIQKTTPAEMRQLFPPQSMSSWMRDIFSPLASQTALVIELKGYPISPMILRMFLSRFFFKDKTPHLVILVQDWMRFSSELDSLKSGIDPNPPPVRKPQSNSILSTIAEEMNIYFACSITGGRDFESVYQEIVRALVQAGHQVPTAHLVESGVRAVEAGIDPHGGIYARCGLDPHE